ncbi:MAG: glycosyltransferase family 39 protein [Candidatus Omnitrophota bacterium]|nr:glycosyltransferase family 39 protein [Candidatus Omnitrophota bacterium]
MLKYLSYNIHNLSDKGKLFLVLAVSFLARIINITMPILEGTAARQIQTAGIAKFFYNNSFDILFPRLDFLTGKESCLILELPLYNAILASLYRMTGGVHEWMGRLVSILFFLGAGFFVYLIIKRLYGAGIALTGLIVYNLSPLGIIFSRAIMPDSAMLFFSTGAVYFLFSFVQGAKPQNYWISAVFTMTALLVKPHSFYILLPLLYLVFYRQRMRCFLDVKNYIFALIVLTPAFFWYSHGSSVHSSLSAGKMMNFSISNWFDPKLFLSPGFYRDIFEIFSGILLTPVGLVLFVLGISVKMRDRIEFVLAAWLAGVTLYLTSFNALLWEPYYYLSVLPIASIFISRVFLPHRGEGLKKPYFSGKTAKILIFTVTALFIGKYALQAYMVPSGYRYIPEAAEAVRRLTGPDDLVVVCERQGSGALLYYFDRKGWVMPVPQEEAAFKAGIVKELEKFRSKGAGYFIAADGGRFSADFLGRNLPERYELIEHRKNKYVIYKLS